MNKKAFTLIEMLAVIIILAIITSLAVVGYTTHLKKSREKSFQVAEKSFKTALEEAYIDCLGNSPINDFCKNHGELYKEETVYLSELINDNYIEPIKNPYNTEKECDINNSYIKVSKKENNVSTSLSYNSDLNYEVCLICGSNRSETCDK